MTNKDQPNQVNLVDNNKLTKLNSTNNEHRFIEPTWFRMFKGAACGVSAGVVVTLIGHPFDTLKVRLQVQQSHNPIYNGMIDCAKKTIQWEGFSGLYTGIASPLAAQLFLRTILFTGFYESTEFLAGHKRSVNQLDRHEYFIAGAITGCLSSFVDSPADLFKSKLQIQILNQKSGLPPPNNIYYTGVFDCFKQITRNYGIRGVFQALGPTMIRNILGYSIYFGSFESIKRLLLREDQRIEDIELNKIVIAGSICGILFWSAIYNVDVIKSAMMADDIRCSHRHYSGVFNCAYKLMKSEGGYSRLWKGFLPCLLRSAPANGVMLLTVDQARKRFPSYSH